jgi:hypothetical protein
MVEFNKKKTYKRYVYSPLSLILLFLILILLIKALWGLYSKERLSATLLEREQAELSRTLERKKELANAVDYLKTDRGIEAEIRSKFRVVKEGESVAVIIGDEKTNATTTSTSTPSSLWQKFIGLFGL